MDLRDTVPPLLKPAFAEFVSLYRDGVPEKEIDEAVKSFEESLRKLKFADSNYPMMEKWEQFKGEFKLDAFDTKNIEITSTEVYLDPPYSDDFVMETVVGLKSRNEKNVFKRWFMRLRVPDSDG